LDVIASQTESPEENTLEGALLRLENMLDGGQENCCEHVLDEFPSLRVDPDLVLELLYTEFAIRSERRQKPEPELAKELKSRFPELEQRLDRVLQVGRTLSPLIVGDKDGPNLIPPKSKHAFSVSPDLPRQIGDYEIVEVLGRGGMGVVYKAIQRSLDRIVALKTVDARRFGDFRTTQQLTREAELASHLQHPNIVQIFEVGSCQETPFFSMEYIAGGTLADALRQYPLSPSIAAKLIATVARAVATAHEKKILHRDLKPSNILLAISDRPEALSLNIPSFGSVAGLEGVSSIEGAKGLDSTAMRDQAASHENPKSRRFEPKVADFGLAIAIEDTTDLTRAIGTPCFMAPEQIDTRFGAVSVRSDVYSLGAMLYHCLSGRPPFQSPTLQGTLEQVQNEEPRSLSSLVRRLPSDLETICNKCLQKNPEGRYATALELAEDLERFLTNKPIKAKAPNLFTRGMKWSKRHPTATTIMVVSAIAACALAWLWRSALSLAEHESYVRAKTEQMLYGYRIALASTELRSHDLDRCREVLNECDPKFRDWEWNYLDAAASEAVWESSSSSLLASSVAISPDGRLVVGGFGQWAKDHPQAIEVWDTHAKRLMWSIKDIPDCEIASVRFNQDGSRLMVCVVVSEGKSPGFVAEWDMQTGGMVRKISSVNARVAEYSPDGKYILVGTTRGVLQVLDAKSGEVKKTMREHGSMILSMAFGPGDRFITTSRDGVVCLHSLERGVLDRLHEMGDPRQVVWLQEAKTVWIQGYSGLVQQFSVDNDSFRFLGSKQKQIFSRIALSPDGLTYAQSGFGKGIEVRMVHNDELIRQIHGHRGNVRVICFDPSSSRMVSGGSDGVLRMWDLRLASDIKERHFDGGGSVADSACHPQRREVAMAIRRTPGRSDAYVGKPRLEVRAIDSMRLLRSVECHHDWLSSVAYSPTGQFIVTGGNDAKIHVWSDDTLVKQTTFDSHQAPITSIGFAGEDVVVSLDSQGKLFAWNRVDGKVLHSEVVTVEDEKLRPLVASVEPNGSQEGLLIVVTPSVRESRVQLKKVGLEQSVREWQVTFPVVCICRSTFGDQIAMGGANGKCSIYDLEAAASGSALVPIEVLVGKESAISSLRFNPSGTRLCLAGDDETIRVFDTRFGAELLKLDALYRPGSILTFSGDGNTIIRFAGRDYQTWSANTIAATQNNSWAYGMAQRALAVDQRSAVRFYCQAAIRDSEHAEKAREMLLRMELTGNRSPLADRAYQDLLEHHPTSKSSAILMYHTLRGELDQVRKRLVDWRDSDLMEDATYLNSMTWFAALIDADAESLQFWGDRLREKHQNKPSSFYSNTLALLESRQGHWSQGYNLAAESLKLGGKQGAPLDWLIQIECLLKQSNKSPSPSDKELKALRDKMKTVLAALRAWNRDRESTTKAQLDDSPFRSQLYRFEVPLLLGNLQQLLEQRGPLNDLVAETIERMSASTFEIN
jgi:eukaryotic-like serine/threonine-protein kinase